MFHVTALPQSTAAVERAFSKINLNKTKLRNCLVIRALEAIVKVCEKFSTNFAMNDHLVRLHANARNSYMQKYAEKDIEAFENIVVE